MNIPRYKVIVQVTIGQMKDQGVKITSRSLWDTSTDNYATVCFQNEHIWASAIVFGLYTDWVGWFDVMWWLLFDSQTSSLT